MSLDPVDDPVPPGGEVSSGVRVRNTGAVVDQLVLDVVGDAAAWARVEPPTVNLLPGEETVATVLFAPPRRSNVPEGPVPFALRVMSTEDVAGSVVEESVVHVGGFSDVTGELVPRTSTGRRVGRHRLCLDNLGNRPEVVSLDAFDPELLLDVRVEPANLTLQPGTATYIKVKARPLKTFWFGPNRSAPFQVVVSPAESTSLTLPAAMVQQSLLPSWFFKAVGVLVLAGAAMVALWFLVLKPTVESTAQDVARSETGELAQAITDASTRAAAAQDSAAAADQKAQTAQEQLDERVPPDGSRPGGGSAEAGGGNGNGNGGTFNAADAIDGRVTLDAPAGGSDRETFTPAADRTVWISDLVLQNPNGDEGVVRIQREDDVLLVFGLQNFRDLDYHFIQPARFSEEDRLVVTVTCGNEAAAGPCSPSVYFTGQSLKPPRRAARPSPSAEGTS